MTCIVGIIDKENDEVVIGGDSAGVSGYNLFIRKDPKVFTNGPFLIGATSSFRMINLLRFSLKVDKQNKNQDTYEYMCTTFIDSVRECFKQGGYLQKFTDGDDQGGDFLVGYNSRLFTIFSDFQVGECYDGISSVGCGSEYALGSLETTKYMDMDTKERINLALEVSSTRSSGVEPPFIIKTNK